MSEGVPTRRPFVVAHPGRHHLYQTALAYAERDRLAGFVTQRWARHPARLRRLAALRLPGLTERATRAAEYYHTRLPADRVHVFPKGAMERTLFRLAGTTPAARMADGTFAREVAALAESHGAGLHLPCTSAVQTFDAVGDVGLPRVLEQYIGHRQVLRNLMLEEIDRRGLTAGAYQVPPDASVERVEANAREAEMADLVICGSDFVRDTFEQQGFPPEKLRVAQYGVDAERYQAVARHRGPDEPLRVAFVGAVGLRKGALDLMEAASKLGAKAVQLEFFGGVELPESLLELHRPVSTLHGHLPRSQLLASLRRCHVMCLPSLFEGSAYAVAEAMSQQMPVIVTPNAGSFARDGEDGFVVPIRSPDAIASALEELRDEDRRAAMGESAAARARAFTWNRYRQELMRAVEDLG